MVNEVVCDNYSQVVGIRLSNNTRLKLDDYMSYVCSLRVQCRNIGLKHEYEYEFEYEYKCEFEYDYEYEDEYEDAM